MDAPIRFMGRRDLRHWAETTLAPVSPDEAEKLVEAILSGNHPSWGDDWSEYLDEMFPQKGWIEKKFEILG